MTHDFSSSLTLNYKMNTLESTQYQAALAITGAWKGTNLDKIYEQLGWESLNERRVSRRLAMFFKIMHNLTPNYLKEPLPFQQGRYRLRANCIINTIPYRNAKFKNSFFQIRSIYGITLILILNALEIFQLSSQLFLR